MRYLAKRGIQVTHANINWYNDEAFDALLNRMIKLTLSLLKEHGQLMLIGVSAGGSLAMNVLGKVKDKRLCAVTICSRLRLAKLPWWDKRTLARMAFLGTRRASKTFFDSVNYCSTTTIPQLSKQDKQRIITVQQWLDDIVPRPTMMIEGVRAYKVGGISHGMGIILGIQALPKIVQNWPDKVPG